MCTRRGYKEVHGSYFVFLFLNLYLTIQTSFMKIVSYISQLQVINSFVSWNSEFTSHTSVLKSNSVQNCKKKSQLPFYLFIYLFMYVCMYVCLFVYLYPMSETILYRNLHAQH